MRAEENGWDHGVFYRAGGGGRQPVEGEKLLAVMGIQMATVFGETKWDDTRLMRKTSGGDGVARLLDVGWLWECSGRCGGVVGRPVVAQPSSVTVERGHPFNGPLLGRSGLQQPGGPDVRWADARGKRRN
jgi:hypothetical protein